MYGLFLIRKDSRKEFICGFNRKPNLIDSQYAVDFICKHFQIPNFVSEIGTMLSLDAIWLMNGRETLLRIGCLDTQGQPQELQLSDKKAVLFGEIPYPFDDCNFILQQLHSI